MFDDFLRQWSAQSGKAFVPFDAIHDYQLYVDGKLRIDGARSFLTSRGIQLPEEKISELAGAKDTRFSIVANPVAFCTTERP